MPNPEWFVKGPQAPARAPTPGEEVWCLQHPDGRSQRCEVRNDSRAGAGWDVTLFEGDELLFSRRCSSEAEARLVAEHARRDLLRTGWVAPDTLPSP